ncbi:MAG: MFS transporter [Acidimicrobiaceae bacterium]|nr:MFS transporter [Ilumatobacteraceae bacterium]
MGNNASIKPTELLRIPAFRLLWTNSFLFILVQSTQRFAFVWLALDLGARSDISGVILFVMGVPALLISLPVGVMSDRMDRRLLLMGSQLGALATTIAIAAMVTTGHITTTWAIVGSFIAGIFIALGQPVRSAMIPTLVPQDKLVGAIAVSTIGSNIGLIIGPATAGPVIRVWGIQGAFWLQAVLYTIGFIALIPLKVPAVPNSVRRKIREDIFEGLRFINGHESVRSLYVLLSSSTLFMMAPWIVLGPQIAREQAGATGSQTTALFALLGVGQFITSMAIMRFNHKMIRKGLWFMCGLCWGSSVQILLGQSNSIPMMGLFLFLWGLGGGFYMNLNQTLIQNNTPPEVMGRVMALHSLLMSGLAPAGALAVGFIARRIDSAPLVFSACGALMLVSVGYFLTFKKHLRPMS